MHSPMVRHLLALKKKGRLRAGGAKKAKIRKVMHEYKHGSLHSGSHSGPIVKNRKQAIAIAMSYARKM